MLRLVFGRRHRSCCLTISHMTILFPAITRKLDPKMQSFPASISFYHRVYSSRSLEQTQTQNTMQQVPYKPPGQGDDGEKFVEFTLSKSGDRVKIAQAFVGHYPQLCQIEGTLTNRAGRAWAVLFDGFEKEMLFNVDAGMRQLIHVQIEVDGKKVDKHLSRQELDILYWGKGVFQKLDVNQDGKLSATELAKTLKALPKTKPPNCAPDTKFQSLQEMISVLDANHDGFVDQQEWLENLGKCAGFYEALAEMKKNERVQQVLRERQEMEG